MGKTRTLCTCLPFICILVFAIQRHYYPKRITSMFLATLPDEIHTVRAVQLPYANLSTDSIQNEATALTPKTNPTPHHTDDILLDYLKETEVTNVNDLDRWTNSNRSLTVVTAFFDIGNYPRGSKASRGPDKYKQWIRVFAWIQNPVVFYTDSEEFEKIFLDLRRNVTSNTKVIRISRDSLWSFQMKPKIEQIFANPKYPKHKPYTTVPNYTCITHSKFPIIADAAKRNIYSSKFFAWVDIGYFREIENATKKFWLEVPTEFDRTKIGATRIFNTRLSANPSTIIRIHMNWIGAGIFLGERDVFLTFTKQYKLSVLRFLEKGLINVEQYMIGAMYSKAERIAHPPRVNIQAFKPINGRTKTTDPWFYLGFLMYKEVN